MARKWEFVSARDQFSSLSTRWDALNLASDNHVLLDSKFVSGLIDRFATPDVLVAIHHDTERPAMAIVYRVRAGFWEVFTPSQSPLGLALFPRREGSGELARALMNALPGYPIQLAIMSQDPEHSPWFPLEENSPLEQVEYMQTGRVRLEGTFEGYWENRSSNLRHNLSRQRRRLKEQGRTLELVVHCEPDAMAGCIREYGRLESAGWKAELGTAIEENNAQGRFYRDVFQRFACSGEALVYQLLLDGKVVATDLCLFRNGMLVVLKTTYDETVKPVSAALLMREDIMRRLYLDGRFETVEFYGRALDWHTKWTNDFRPMYHLNCHRNAVVSGLRNLVRSMR